MLKTKSVFYKKLFLKNGEWNMLCINARNASAKIEACNFSAHKFTSQKAKRGFSERNLF
jgi:hypothetical protein